MVHSAQAALAGGLLLVALSYQSLSAALEPEPGAWLETSPPANWNTPGADLPLAPAPYMSPDPRCGVQERPSESPEEDQVVAAGWHVFNAALVGWGLRVVDGLVGYDGMCRPIQFQGFVFADGQFAGTISPAPMDSRTDGVGRILDLRGPGNLNGQFVRYTATDPLCCPSSTFAVEYTVDRGGDAPVLVPMRSTRTARRDHSRHVWPDHDAAMATHQLRRAVTARRREVGHDRNSTSSLFSRSGWSSGIQWLASSKRS